MTCFALRDVVFADKNNYIGGVTFWVAVISMILSFKHKGLERFYRSGSTLGIQAQHKNRLKLILSNLDVAETAGDMDLPGLKLHELKGNRKGIWSVTVSGNWRVTFRFKSRDAEVVNYEDYH